MTDIVCARVRLQPGSLGRVRQWAAFLQTHRDEALRALEAEGVLIESVFLDSAPEGDELVYYMRADSMERAMAVAAASVAEIDRYHRDFKKATWVDVRRLELLVDLSLCTEPGTGPP